MKINICRQCIVGKIKRQFNAQYPFLKIEFLIRPNPMLGRRHPIIAPDNMKLERVQPRMREGAIVINDLTTVGELESFFHNHLLEVQVFRQSENLWLETTMTDKWSLAKQNGHGKEISEFNYMLKPRRDYGNDIADGVS